MPNNFFYIFAALGRRHAYVSKHIILKTNIYEVYKNITNKCKRVGSKQISFGCSDITSDIHILSVI